jgi:hypothetical protein
MEIIIINCIQNLTFNSIPTQDLNMKTIGFKAKQNT